MNASELIKMIQEKCNGEDPEVEFQSYEWNDDLEDLSYHKRDFDGIDKIGEALIIHTSR